MRFKSLLLSAASVAVIGGATQQAQAGPFYVSVFGGVNFLHNNSAATSYTSRRGDATTFTTFDHTGAISERSRTGFVLGGAFGVHLTSWVPGLRAELEASYRRNHIHGNWHTHITAHQHTSGDTSNPTTGSQGTLSGHMSTFAVMANVWYDIDLGSKFKPYIGGGAGWARSHVGFVAVNTPALDSSSAFANENSGFAYQLGLGLKYEVMHGTSIGVGYRYFRGPDVGIFFVGKQGTTFPIKFRDENQSVEVSLSIDID